MSPAFLSFLLGILISTDLKALANGKEISCEGNHEEHMMGSIGVVVDLSSRVGREQKIAMETALKDFVWDSPCSKVHLHFQCSRGHSSRPASHVIELLKTKKAQAIVGALTFQEADLVWELDEVSKHIPIISLMPTATSTLILPHQPTSFITMSYNINVQMQCIAAIVGHFGWRKVIAIYERSNSLSGDSVLLTHLSDSLRPVGSVLEHHFAFPRLNLLSEPDNYIEEKLKTLRSKNISIFAVLQCSLDFSIALFKKAKELGMMDKGYVWIISDDIASLLDSFESSTIHDYMQGVIGFKTNFVDNSDSFKSFERRFSKNYITDYPEEHKHSSPSVHALRAYDATMATIRAMKHAQGKAESDDLIKYILADNFKGLSGNICFKNGTLVQKPVFQIVNLIGRSYRVIGMWTPEFGFLEESIEHFGRKIGIGNDIQLNSIIWPGGELNVPKGWTLIGMEKPLRIGVPAKGAFKQFVNVTYDPYSKATTIKGFSIEVFEAAVQRLPYHLPYVLVPFYGTYDEMVTHVRNKTLDAAVGDTEIMADRYKFVDFTQPYLDSGLVMVVAVKPDITKTGTSFLQAFKLNMWIAMAAMSLLTGVVIWLNEYVNNNPAFTGPLPQQLGAILWFSVNVLSFAQRETIGHNLSRLVLSTWLFVTMIVAACFTGAVTTMMTAPKLEPSEGGIDFLLRTNAAVGCNGNSFIVRYLTDVLRFRPENVRKISSIDEYPKAFESKDIKAAFFVAPHAKVFLAEYCKGYTIAGRSYKLGGFGFVFPKGSSLANDISEAILEVTQSGTINHLETYMLSFLNCSLLNGADDSEGPSLDIKSFYILFLISGGLLTVTFLDAMRRLAEKHWSIHNSIEASLISRRIYRWASMLLFHLCTKFRTRLFRRPLLHTPTNEFTEHGIELAPTLRVQELVASSVTI